MPTERSPNSLRRPPPTSPRPRSLPRTGWVIGAALVALALMATSTSVADASGDRSAPTVPPRDSAVAFSAAPTPASTGTNGSVAWGSAANLTAHASFVGAYNASSSLTGGNLTRNGTYLALDESVSVDFAAFATLNVSTPAPGHLHVTLQAAELRALAIHVAAAGDFPAAGTYPANASPVLVPMNVSLAAAVQILDAYRAFVNLTTGPNGSLALNDEHVEVARGVNLSLAAVNYPNVTALPGGALSIRYTTGAIVARGWVAEDLAANFSPAIPVVAGPLFVGKNWTANSTVQFHGGVAYASAIAVRLPNGVSAQQVQSGSASLNGTTTVALRFTVTGTRTVYDVQGQPETDYVIAYTSGSGAGGVLLADGILVLPLADASHAGGLAPAVPEPAATAPLAPSANAGARSVYSPTHRMVVSQQASPASGQIVTASPMTPSAARLAMSSLGHPVVPLAGAPTFPWGLLVVGAAALVGLGVVVREVRQRRPPL